MFIYYEHVTVILHEQGGVIVSDTDAEGGRSAVMRQSLQNALRKHSGTDVRCSCDACRLARLTLDNAYGYSDKPCVECGNIFVPGRPAAEFCSETCANRVRQRRHRARLGVVANG